VSRTTQILLAGALIAGSLAAYWFFALAPKREQVAKLDGDITPKTADVQQAETTAKDYEASRKAYRTNYATVVRLGKAVPADDDVRSLVVQLDASAKHSKVDFDALNVGSGSTASSAGATAGPKTAAAQGATPPPGASAVGTGGFLTMPFSLSFEGSFFRLGDFFSQLERYVSVKDDAVDVTGRLLRIETFKLTPNDDSSTLKADVGASTYLLPESEGLTAGATAQGPSGATSSTPAPPTGGTTASSAASTTTTNAGVTG
jgi:Tfp pilus assembly protein PilO